ncbi:hypothetical protein [Lentzea guizhouensis]|nr:hypothetical protein [Lentzea guizhouensis]
MSNRETLPPIHGTGWVDLGRRGVRRGQRRTGNAAIDLKIQDHIEGAAHFPTEAGKYMQQAWELYAAHGSTGKRIAREARALAASMTYLLLWLVIGVILVIVSAYMWG